MRGSQKHALLGVALEADFEEEGGFKAWRIVKTDRFDSGFVDGFRSSYEMGKPPRPKSLEDAAVIHMGVSMFFKRSSAVKTAKAWPKIGGFVAEVHLRPNNGFCWARTGSKGHLTVWGDPVKLAKQAVDTYPVR